MNADPARHNFRDTIGNVASHVEPGNTCIRGRTAGQLVYRVCKS